MANTIVLDPINGDVIIGGFATKPNNKKEIICIRLNASNGSILKTFTQTSEDPTGDAYIKKIIINTNGDIYFTAGEKSNSGKEQVVVRKIRSNGVVSWQKKITGVDNILPSDVEYGTDGLYVISVIDGINDSYLITKYEELELDSSKTYYGGKPAWMKHELIVGFNPSAIKKTAIDNQIGTKIMEFGSVSDFFNY